MNGTPVGGARCTGVILAGGRASRFGGLPKGLERVGGRRIVDRVAASLRLVCDDLLLVANDSGASEWLHGVRCVPDRIGGAGPIGGLTTAFAELDSDPDAGAIVLGWDMPFVPPSLLGELRSLGEREQTAAVVPASGGADQLEPLCGWYAVRRCRSVAERRLAGGERSMAGLLDELQVRVLPYARLLDWGDPGRLFLNVNSPADLELARRLADPVS